MRGFFLYKIQYPDRNPEGTTKIVLSFFIKKDMFQLTPEQEQMLSRTDYTQFLPVGKTARVSKMAYRRAMDSGLLQKAWNSVEKEAAERAKAFQAKILASRREAALAAQRRAEFNATYQPRTNDQGIIQKFLSYKYSK